MAYEKQFWEEESNSNADREIEQLERLLKKAEAKADSFHVEIASLQSEIDRLKEEKKDLLEALQDIFDTLSSDDTVITQFLPECDSTYKPSGWLSKAKELLTRIK